MTDRTVSDAAGPSIDLADVRRTLERSGYGSGAALPPITWFGDDPAMAGELGRLVRDGIKTATAGLLWKWEADGRPIPRSGDRQVIVDWSGSPLCVIEMMSVEVTRYDRVSAQFARDEAEGDGSLQHWRDVHWAFFTREAQRIGRTPLPDMPVICLRFRVVHVVDS